MQDSSANIISLSKTESKKFKRFRELSKKADNFYSFNLINGKERAKNDKKNIENESFYDKYEHLSNYSGPDVFELEKELAKYVKFWHSENLVYKVDKLFQDDFFNEENVLSNVLKNKYIKKNYSIVPFQLIDYVIGELEKKVFDIELLQNIRNPNSLLDAPLRDKGFIEFLLNNDIEEKLHYMYQGEKPIIGYSYIIEKIVVFDLFLIILILKNYPFYVLRKDRLEILFKSLKKYKSFPYPIGSIGMDLFTLLINELYLPGVSIFQEVRKTFLLDIIDPNIIDINPSDFIKVVSFEEGNLVTVRTKNKDEININNKEMNNNMSSNNFKLHEQNDLTFTAMIVFASYILYNSEDKKDSEKEEIYFDNILALFEKRLKQKKDESKIKDNSPNIFEKNIINNIFNLIDQGLDSNYNKFKKELKSFNDKLISKSKESHETTSSKPRENINLRKFLYHNIHNMKLPLEIKKKFKPVRKMKSLKDNFSQKRSVEKRNMQKKGEKGNKGLINNEGGDENQIEDKESLEKIENLRLINEYRDQLFSEKDVPEDPILNDYIDNFSKLRKKYFKHLKEFQVDNYNFSDDKEKDAIFREEIIQFNTFSKIKEKQLTELYKQKYIVKEHQLIYFLKNLDVWKCNIKPLYRKKLADEYKESKKKEKELIKSKKEEKKDSDSLGNENINNINILEDNLREIPVSIRNNILSEEKEKAAKIVNSDLPFNYELYLIPGENKNKADEKRPDNPLTKFISKQDFIYKSVIGDFYWNLFNIEKYDEDCNPFLDTPIQLYLREAQHFYNLKVFQCLIKSQNQNPTELDELRIRDNYYYIYGSIHIESNQNLVVKLDKETIIFNKEKNTIKLDIINIFDENKEDKGRKINDIERYLVNPNCNCFQVFISAGESKVSVNYDANSKEDYLKKFVVPMMNFDLKSLNFEAKKIIIKPEDENKGFFELTPTFLNMEPSEVNYFEINYDSNINNENEDNSEIGVYSFDVKIKTFIDLYKRDD